MKNLFLLLVTIFLAYACQTKKEEAQHQHGTSQETAPADTVKKSIPQEEHAMMGEAHFTIKYHAPAVRGRTIWGGLVPYNEVWVTGAHRATSFEVSKDILLNGTKIPAGKYALFTIPGKDTWTVIINKKWDQHLADEYSQAEDVARFEVKPEALTEVQERLRYSLKVNNDKSGVLTFAWELLQWRLSVEVI
jgi:hypothetical protein